MRESGTVEAISGDNWAFQEIVNCNTETPSILDYTVSELWDHKIENK